MYFSRKPWLPGQKRPSQIIIQALRQREFLRSRRKRERYCEQSEEVLRVKYNLPYETTRAVFTLEEWDYFIKLNSYNNTRKAANDYALQRPMKTVE